jgi:hypothetical protein
MGILIPIFSFIIYIRFVAPYFEGSLEKFKNTSRLNCKKIRAIEKKDKRSRKLSEIFCFNKLERAFYNFSKSYMSKDRKFKLQITSILAAALIMPIIFVINMTILMHSSGEFLSRLREHNYSYAFYTVVLMLSTIFPLAAFSENPNAAWIYRTLPIKSPETALRGTFKAMIVKYVIPIFIVCGCFSLYIWRLMIIPHIILIFLNLLILMILDFLITGKFMPFSREVTAMQSASKMLALIITLVGSAIFCGIHLAFVKFIPFGIYINILLSGCLVSVLWVTAFRVKWRDIKE